MDQGGVTTLRLPFEERLAECKILTLNKGIVLVTPSCKKEDYVC